MLKCKIRTQNTVKVTERLAFSQNNIYFSWLILNVLQLVEVMNDVSFRYINCVPGFL